MKRVQITMASKKKKNILNFPLIYFSYCLLFLFLFHSFLVQSVTYGDELDATQISCNIKALLLSHNPPTHPNTNTHTHTWDIKSLQKVPFYLWCSDWIWLMHWMKRAKITTMSTWSYITIMEVVAHCDQISPHVWKMSHFLLKVVGGGALLCVWICPADSITAAAFTLIDYFPTWMHLRVVPV